MAKHSVQFRPFDSKGQRLCLSDMYKGTLLGGTTMHTFELRCWKFDYGKYKYTGLRPCATI